MLGCPRATSTSKAYPLPLAKSLPGSPVNCSDHSRRDMATAGICANQDSCSAAPIAASSFSPSAAITLARSWRAVSGLGRLTYPNWGNNLLSLPNVVSCSGAPNGPLNLWDMLRFFADVFCAVDFDLRRMEYTAASKTGEFGIQEQLTGADRVHAEKLVRKLYEQFRTIELQDA